MDGGDPATAPRAVLLAHNSFLECGSFRWLAGAAGLPRPLGRWRVGAGMLLDELVGVTSAEGGGSPSPGVAAGARVGGGGSHGYGTGVGLSSGGGGGGGGLLSGSPEAGSSSGSRKTGSVSSAEDPTVGRDAWCGCLVVCHAAPCVCIARQCCGGSGVGGVSQRLQRVLGAAGEATRRRAQGLASGTTATPRSAAEPLPLLPRMLGVSCPCCGEDSEPSSSSSSSADGCVLGMAASPDEVLGAPWGYSARAAEAIAQRQRQGGGGPVAVGPPLGVRGVPLSCQAALGAVAFGDPGAEGVGAEDDGLERGAPGRPPRGCCLGLCSPKGGGGGGAGQHGAGVGGSSDTVPLAQDAEEEARRARAMDPVLWREGAPRSWVFLVDVMDENVLRGSLASSGGARLDEEEWAQALAACDRRLGIVQDADEED